MVVVTVGDVGVEGVVAAAVPARRDQLGMDNQSFAAISGYNSASVEVLCPAPDDWATTDSLSVLHSWVGCYILDMAV